MVSQIAYVLHDISQRAAAEYWKGRFFFLFIFPHLRTGYILV